MLRVLPPMFKPVNNLICCKTGLMWVVKRATSLFNSFCSNVAKQVAHFCCPFFGTFRNLENFCLWNPESGKKLESGILGFGILNLSKKIWNPTNEIRTNPESTTWKPESKTFLDSLTRGETSRKGLI